MLGFVKRILRQPQAALSAWIEIDELRRRQNEGRLLLIDVRGPDEFNAPPGHLPGAINIPLPELADRTAELAAHDQPVVLVCKTDRRSANAAAILLEAGLPNVAVLRGGTDGWHERGLPLD